MEWRLLTLFGLPLLVHAPLLYLPSNIVKMLTSIYILVGIYVLLWPVASFFLKVLLLYCFDNEYVYDPRVGFKLKMETDLLTIAKCKTSVSSIEVKNVSSIHFTLSSFYVVICVLWVLSLMMLSHLYEWWLFHRVPSWPRPDVISIFVCFWHIQTSIIYHKPWIGLLLTHITCQELHIVEVQTFFMANITVVF